MLVAGALVVLAGAAAVGSRAWRAAEVRAHRALVAPEPSYVGRAACARCHEAEVRAWAGSHHDLAMTEASAETVRGDFSDVVFEGDGERARFFRRDGRYWIEATMPDGRAATFEVAYTFGWDPLQQYLVHFPGGRLQAFPVAWDVAGRRWFSLHAGHSIAGDDWLHWTQRGQNWNGMCASCHSTHVRKGYDPAADTYATTWSEIDVSCEACHGPASRHVAWEGTPAAQRAPLADRGLTRRTSGLTPRAAVEVCAPCHARRTELADSDPRRTELLDGYLPVALGEGVYHADGQIQDEDFEYGSFVQSKMYRRGVRCGDCHDPHSLKAAVGDAPCVRCHSPGRYAAASHHHHGGADRAGGAAGAAAEATRCVSCHMPRSTYMGVHRRADHSLRVPRPDLTRTIGVPNACSQAGCHADRPLEWVEGAYDRWYGGEHAPHFGTALAAGRRGDPAARGALVALAGDRREPVIARATAVSLLASQVGTEVDAAFRAALADPEPWLRHAAVAALPSADTAEGLAALAPLLADPVRAVRVEAAARLAGVDETRLDADTRVRLRGATAEYVAAMERSLDFAFAGHDLGLFHERRGDDARAEAAYRRAIAVDPLAAPSKVNLASLLARRGEHGEAERLLREVVARDPGLPEASYALGLLVAETGSMEEAAGLLARAAAAMPGNGRAAFNAGLALARVGRDAEAEALLRRARQLDPSSTDAKMALADFLARRGRESEARALIGR